MVVGVTQYQNRNEAFPLDKKTLNKVALRSFFVGASDNSESGESVGWTYALQPALRKIHENDEDYQLSLSHNLEYVKTESFFSTLSMGTVLALEAQKCDLETIRSTRTTMNVLAQGLSNSFISLLVLTLCGYTCANLAQDGDITPVLVFMLVGLLVTIVLRFVLVKVGYSYATKILEKANHNQSVITHASKAMGVFTIGGLIVTISKFVSIGSWSNTSSSLSWPTTLSYYLPGVLGLCVTYLMYYLLTKKNWSIVKCVTLVFLIGILVSLTGFGLSLIY